MQKFTNCPVCSSQKISFRYTAGTARQPKEAPKWSVYGCEDCGLVFVNPRPTWDELSDYYPENWQCYNTYVPEEEDVVKQAKKLNEYRHIPIPVGKRLLDVGCGGGSIIQVFKKLGVEVAGIEPSSSAAAAARECGVDVFTGTVEEYVAEKGTDEKFDVILCSHVLGATPFPAETLDCMRQLLAPNGYIWVAVPNADSPYARQLGWRWHSTDYPYNLIGYTPKTLALAGEKAGLAIQRNYTYSLPDALRYSICLWQRYRWFVPHKVSRLFLSDERVERMAKELDSRGEGEAILMEFCHPQSVD
ncbi:class I SAM-dependent methyltransferase [Microcoleus sp. F4-D5]|uniref:class I SAM-dependent methyltransferase n=1 Tax=Microcoleus sp. F4-D5 TaxID=2818760 RepID=UPI002FD6B830